MLTPKFELSQDDEFITIVVHAPYTNVAKAKFYVEEEMIVFYSKPYYLRLHLPKGVLNSKRNGAEYDADKGLYTARVVKENKGDFFEGLEMLTKLMTPPETEGKSQLKPNLVEEISSSVVEGAPSEQTEPHLNQEEEEEEEEEVSSELNIGLCPAPEAESIVFGGTKYGFAQKKSDFPQKLMLEFCEVFDIRDLGSSTRKQDRMAHEAEHFSDDHYLADLYETEEITDFLSFQPWWVHSQATGVCELTTEAKELMLKLPKKNYLLDENEQNIVHWGLVDIIFGYAYNCRVLLGENNIESGWTIAKLSASLSWLDSYSSLQEVIVSCFRRALTYPLYRHWGLCVKVLEDVQVLFSSGQTFLLRCLLDVYTCMIASDPRFVLNDLYITDYCVWIQSAHSKHIQSMAEALKKVKVTKADVGLELEELETAAELVLQEQEEGRELSALTGRLGQLSVDGSKVSLDSDDDSDDSEEDDEKSDQDSADESEEDDDDDGSDDDDDDGNKEITDSNTRKAFLGKAIVTSIDEQDVLVVEQATNGKSAGESAAQSD